MLLATRNIGLNDTIRYVVSYRGFLARGTILMSAVTLATSFYSAGAPTATPLAAVTQPTFDPSKTEVIFFVTAGAIIGTFSVTLTVQDDNGQTVNDTVNFNIVAS